MPNKLIITWKNYSNSPYGVTRESVRCNSEEKAETILSKRPNRRIYFATFHNSTGGKKVFNINTEKTIQQL